MDVKIMVAAHKEFPMPKERELYLPVLVGAKRNYKPGIDYQRDDDGENISEKNPNYNELTAIYWAWKNLDADAVGLVHYRRFLSKKRKSDLENILNKREVEELLAKTPIILPKKRKYYIETNYSHYIHAHHQEPIDVTRKVIVDKYPEYLDAFDQMMKRTSAHMFNMFVMKKELFNEYASWLFDILTQVEKQIDISEYSVQEARVFGYLAERLMDVWILTNHFKYTEVNWIQLGKKDTLRKLVNFLKRKFFKKSKKITHFE
ncbi:DUF4422 domain-containing protein [Pediococcus acidilactici]|jgi:hypothetical protein|uniref:DUF4422 domain-containing protein n=1 Tax=Pediococcus acidilactici TaxID=1254 RepID=UPI001914359B|nr:DUF4422 domain-containing protein [Pediococcus acidilactici]QQP83821.1 DUF4422 domain-containing protein [Pediococcus acidilactici]